MEELTKGEKLLWEKIKALEAQLLAHTCCNLPHYQVPYYQQPAYNPQVHYHQGGQPCYNNPCVWC